MLIIVLYQVTTSSGQEEISEKQQEVFDEASSSLHHPGYLVLRPLGAPVFDLPLHVSGII